MLVAIEMVSIAKATIAIVIWSVAIAIAIRSVAITKESIAIMFVAIIQSLVGVPLFPGEA